MNSKKSKSSDLCRGYHFDRRQNRSWLFRLPRLCQMDLHHAALPASGCTARFFMSYRNKTYVIFDGDNDMWAYAYMKGWKENKHVDFDFHDAHDIKPLTDRASEETVRERLRERFSSAKQAIVLIGESTKNLYRFVRWEMEVAQNLDLPIIAINLNGDRRYNPNLCPAILKDHYVVHVAFKMKIIQYALDNFPNEYSARNTSAAGNRHYNDTIYARLDL